MGQHSPEGLPEVLAGCLEACRRCETVVEAVLSQNPSAYPAVGPHLRHCVDHFHLLLDGWREGAVNYDARPRDPRLERDPASMRAALDGVSRSLRSLKVEDLTHPLVVLQSPAPGREPAASPTSLDRELLFLSGHTIHHIAIMVLAARSAGVLVPERLAAAYSAAAEREPAAMSR